jgi:hypothetical protein
MNLGWQILRNSLALLIFLSGIFPTVSYAEKWEYLRNDSVELGILMDYGAGIGSFGKIKPSRNLLNHADPGRLVQQSFYGDTDGSDWNGKPWRWNPVQGGCWQTTKGIIKEFRNDGKNFYARTKPINWAGCEEIDATMEEWIQLAGNIAHIKFRFTNGARDNTTARHQEMPAVFVDYGLSNLVYYQGTDPWTDALVTHTVPGWPNIYTKAAENWAAYVDSSDWGIGVFTPGTSNLTCYRYTGDEKTGPSASACSYFAPIRTLTIAKDLSLEYDVYLFVGNIKAMREEFAVINKTGQPSQPYESTRLPGHPSIAKYRKEPSFSLTPAFGNKGWGFRHANPLPGPTKFFNLMGHQDKSVRLVEP